MFGQLEKDKRSKIKKTDKGKGGRSMNRAAKIERKRERERERERERKPITTTWIGYWL
jgi:hypothetical protein